MRKVCAAAILFLFCNSSYANLPYYPLNFPRDEAAHYKNVPYDFNQLVEWWYVNGKLTTDDGKHLSYDVAFFNPAKKVVGVIRKPFLHIQISDLDNKKSLGTKTYFLIDAGKVSTDKLDITVDNDFSLHKMMLNGKEVYALKAQSHNENNSLKLNLILQAASPVFQINENGLMPMPHNTNSYYYSIPHFNTTGKISINNINYSITNQAGDSWMDHQWGDFSPQDNGWEWFSIRLENGLLANIFLNIEYKKNTVIGGLANFILPNGEKHFISYKDFNVTRDNYWYDQKLSISYPTTFNFNFPTLNLTMTNIAAFPEQEVNGYWEGYCNVNAVYNKQDVNGFSYMEIVYNKPSK